MQKHDAVGNDAGCDLSVIVPAFNEKENIQPFFEASARAFEQAGIRYELVFVDDGSSDGTYREIRRMQHEHPEVPVTAISFSRNFGKEAAMYAGLEHATGRCMGFIDADLQQRPETMVEMYFALVEDDDCDCVAAYQENRHAGAVRDWFSKSFYGILAKSSKMDVMHDASDFRVFRWNVGQALLRLGERNRFSKGLFAWVGFNTKPFAYTPEERFAGTTSWSFGKLVRYAIDGLLAFTTFPLKIATYLGIITSLAAIVYLVVVVVQRVAFGVDVPGYATIVTLILFFGGLQMLMLGVVGSYIARDYMEGKQRPIYIARRVEHTGGGTGKRYGRDWNE